MTQHRPDPAPSLRLNVLSDLHLGQTGMPWPHTDSDLVILAGDIARPARAVEWASGLGKPVLYVPGNHEFYGSSIEDTIAELRRLTEGTSITLLHNDEVNVMGVRFLGTTLWTDFNLDPSATTRDKAITHAQELLYDFSRIRSPASAERTLSPADMEDLYAHSRAWLADRLQVVAPSPTVVISHHAPSPRSIHPRFEGSVINTCFVSNCEDLMHGRQVYLWIHGHTHNSFDYSVNGTRVVCNPRGMVMNGQMENPEFDPGFVVEVALEPGLTAA
jgi:predicted phosphodiesterase